MIANTQNVSGSSTSFKATKNVHGWVAYKNGKIVKKAQDMPIELTMKKAYDIYKALT